MLNMGQKKGATGVAHAAKLLESLNELRKGHTLRHRLGHVDLSSLCLSRFLFSFFFLFLNSVSIAVALLA